jgi:hypothetical protein
MSQYHYGIGVLVLVVLVLGGIGMGNTSIGIGIRYYWYCYMPKGFACPLKLEKNAFFGCPELKSIRFSISKI